MSVSIENYDRFVLVVNTADRHVTAVIYHKYIDGFRSESETFNWWNHQERSMEEARNWAMKKLGLKTLDPDVIHGKRTDIHVAGNLRLPGRGQIINRETVRKPEGQCGLFIYSRKTQQGTCLDGYLYITVTDYQKNRRYVMCRVGPNPKSGLISSMRAKLTTLNPVDLQQRMALLHSEELFDEMKEFFWKHAGFIVQRYQLT